MTSPGKVPTAAVATVLVDVVGEEDYSVKYLECEQFWQTALVTASASEAFFFGCTPLTGGKSGGGGRVIKTLMIFGGIHSSPKV